MSAKLSSWRRVAIESATCRCARRTPTRDVIRGKGSDLACDEAFFGTGGAAGGETFRDQEARGGDRQARMMVKPSPPPAFVVAQPQFLLQILVVALDAPAHVRR